MEYRLRLAKRMLFNKKGSLIGAVLAVTIGILVIHVNFVIFQGLFDAIVRDISNYRNGDVLITDEENYIDKSDQALVNWFERIPYVEAATPRLSSSTSINMTKFGTLHEKTRVPIVGVDPFRDIQASTVHETVTEGQYVFARNSIVLGSNVARDLGGAEVGDSLKLKIVDRYGQDQIRRFVVTGIATSPGGQGFDYSVVVHIDTLRDLMNRKGESGSIMVKLNDPTKASDVKNFFLAAFPNDDFIAETIEESAEEQLAGFRSGIAMINMIGYFGMMSSAFAIVTIQMMLVNGKTREIGVMRSIGATRKDILIIFIFQGMIIGVIGAGVGTAAGLGYTFYAKETKMSFNNSLPLEVSYNWEKIIQTAVLSFMLAIIASLYPSYRATKLLPVEAMRTV
ncbi:MAG: ABC transporter permease [Nitrosopumilales archaeon CG15_BIG_FIL_POST_REV_8_21_14_020_33_23]|nr:MAG: ABC transporter permease [Nitrosopumilales archaeon CG11_big_fil_rev_8_21_14_0_20_33_24]PIW35707.1 MAG: ABC transporter permease [Nitrosopumilales archaeon CG15_BIG_FIL_POST_REV_8_21_14_020_33_23]PIY89951.1 MAG: ABC transporter permease [Nitrosopumilales archaeon CG_4_10_14_0_8_um_filter_34_8]PJB96603.1 MAG: ABC transporter permease [Nitrosopumilales archaeon CG_4_9_14_0_8_um_filter_34_10]